MYEHEKFIFCLALLLSFSRSLCVCLSFPSFLRVDSTAPRSPKNYAHVRERISTRERAPSFRLASLHPPEFWSVLCLVPGVLFFRFFFVFRCVFYSIHDCFHFLSFVHLSFSFPSSLEIVWCAGLHCFLYFPSCSLLLWLSLRCCCAWPNHPCCSCVFLLFECCTTCSLQAAVEN